METHIIGLLHQLLGIISGILIGVAGIPYIIAILKKIPGLSPRPLSWVGWALLMSATLYSQIESKGWEWSHSVLVVSIIGCSVIALLTIGNGNIDWLDIGCVLLAAGCFILYKTTHDVWLTTGMAIVADLAIGFPTLRNAYHDPLSEKSIGWTIGSIGLFIAVLNCFGTQIIYFIFPIYLFIFNATIVFLTHRKKIPH